MNIEDIIDNGHIHFQIYYTFFFVNRIISILLFIGFLRTCLPICTEKITSHRMFIFAFILYVLMCFFFIKHFIKIEIVKYQSH